MRNEKRKKKRVIIYNLFIIFINYLIKLLQLELMTTHFRGVILVWFRGNCFRVAPFVFSFFFSFGFVFVVLSFFGVGGLCFPFVLFNLMCFDRGFGNWIFKNES
jgi:hypothetical protein